MGNTNPPIILSFSPLDPSGRGGVQADIETASSLGCYCTPIATALCTSGDVESTHSIPIQASLLIEQSRSVLEDMPVAAIHVGYTGSVNNVEAIHTLTADYPSQPLVFQPCLNLWGSDEQDESDLPDAISSLLLPAATITLLSLEEARLFSQKEDSIHAVAEELLLKELDYALISHTDVTQKCYAHSLYDDNGLVASYTWKNTQCHPDDYGPACTLGGAITAFLAHGSTAKSAVDEALRYTQQSLAAAKQLSFGKTMPNRLFWANNSQKEPHISNS